MRTHVSKISLKTPHNRRVCDASGMGTCHRSESGGVAYRPIAIYLSSNQSTIDYKNGYSDGSGSLHGLESHVVLAEFRLTKIRTCHGILCKRNSTLLSRSAPLLVLPVSLLVCTLSRIEALSRQDHYPIKSDNRFTLVT